MAMAVVKNPESTFTSFVEEKAIYSWNYVKQVQANGGSQ